METWSVLTVSEKNTYQSFKENTVFYYICLANTFLRGTSCKMCAAVGWKMSFTAHPAETAWRHMTASWVVPREMLHPGSHGRLPVGKSERDGPPCCTMGCAARDGPRDGPGHMLQEQIGLSGCLFFWHASIYICLAWGRGCVEAADCSE